jgi:hypothetical protein
MASQVDTDPQAGIATLLSGIVQDARQLLIQQLTLFQVELKHDLHRTISASLSMVAGGMLCLVAVLTLAMAGGYFLSWAIPDLPVWGGFAIEGVCLAVLGGILFFIGKHKFDTFSVLPVESVKGLKENIQWKTK